jgi:PAS domain S-box-containing protein
MSKPEDNILDVVEAAEDLELRSRAIEETPFGITIADMRIDDEPIIYANTGFTRITGYPEDEVLGRNCRFLQGEGTSDKPVGLMREAIETGDSVQVILENYRKDGTAFWNEVTLSPLEDDSGEITHYLGFQQDVSQRKEYEQQLEAQRDNLTVLNEMVRHDIRNELQVALASLEVIKARDTVVCTEQVETALQSINQAIDLTNTAREVADVMLDTGADYAPVEIALLIEGELADCRSSYPHAELSVEGTLPQVRVRANELLESVFRNLLTNAVQHNDAEEPRVVVASSLDDDDVVITISDNGPGLSDTQRDRLFERGWSADASGGTGIGLYIAEQLVENYGGTLSLADESTATPETDLGGTTFVVRLPRAQ